MLSIHYAPTRGEVFAWYGRLWLRRLWPIDLGMAFTLATMCAFLSSNVRGLAYPPMFAAVVGGVALLALWPVLKVSFAPPQPRTLTIGPDGLANEPAARGDPRAWREVMSIEDQNGAVVLNGANRNAVIVPRRAFASDASRDQFLAQARAWKAAGGGAGT